MRPSPFPLRASWSAACAAGFLAACIVSPTNDAPIIERSQVRSNEAPVVKAPSQRVAPPVSREAHDGLYMVQAGDTLYSVALAFGQDFRDIARWNGLEDPSHLRVGQALRVVPDAATADAGGSAESIPVAPVPSGSVQARTLEPGGPAAAAESSGEASAARSPGADKAVSLEPASAWSWPSAGRLVERFDEARNKGIDISGSVGDAVWAANDGQVVYSGNGLRGYGNLVIIKHTDDYVSAYAHNNEILVTQGQAVKRGQRIATLGMTDATNPRLHFEIRRRGKPVDPLTYLPSR